MFTCKPAKDLSSAIRYFQEHLSQGEYYTQDPASQGQWLGKGTQTLGIDLGAPIDHKAFESLCKNRHPLTRQQLTPRLRKGRRIFFDFTVSAPKSVSIMALIAGDERVAQAHRKAWQIALDELEKLAQTTDQTGGKRVRVTTGEIVAAAFEHHESRSLDPQLHTHLIVWNLTLDPGDKRWKALETRAIFDRIGLLTEIYRSTLAQELIGLGYHIRPTNKGAFEIQGVSQDILDRFSKRSQQIRKAEAQLIRDLGKPISNNARATLAHTTRSTKQKGFTTQEILNYQHSQLSREELAQLRQLSQCVGKPSTYPQPEVIAQAVHEACQFAKDHLFERKCVIQDHELLEVALAQSRGKFSFESVNAWMDQQHDLLRADGRITTRAMLALEKQIIAHVNQTQNHFPPLVHSFTPDPNLTPEQLEVIQTILGSTDGVIGLRGGAGTGKTWVTGEVIRAIGKHQRQVVVLAPTSGAVDVLRQDGIGQAKTIQRFLIDPAMQQAATGAVVLVDEAGLLSTRQMAPLFELAKKHHFRVILSGDTRQHHSVESGDALRVLEGSSSLKTSSLSTVMRQSEVQYRGAIEDIAKGRLNAGFKRLEKLGAIHQIDDEERYERLAASYVQSVNQGKSALCVSPSWREIAEVTDAIRLALHASGALGADTDVLTHRPLHWTQAQKRDLRQYNVGQILLFHRKTRDFESGQWARVERIEDARLVVRTASGQEHFITRKQAGCFELFQETQIPLAPGDRVLLQGNIMNQGLLNGQLATVKSIAKDQSIKLTDGRWIPPEFKRFTHGYCLTSMGSQGKSADHVHIAVDSIAKAAVHREQFYVCASRGREKIQIFTDDKRALLEEISKSGQRQSALEFIRSARKLATAQTLPGVQIGLDP